jgi:hypothetical protein
MPRKLTDWSTIDSHLLDSARHRNGRPIGLGFKSLAMQGPAPVNH